MEIQKVVELPVKGKMRKGMNTNALQQLLAFASLIVLVVIFSIASAILFSAPEPCTGTGNNRICTLGLRLVETFIISFITEVLSERLFFAAPVPIIAVVFA